MQARKMALAGSGLLALLFCAGEAAAQAARVDRSTQTIDVTGARAVPRALDVIEKRYGVLIDYVDPQYAASEDTQIVRAVRGTPVRRPFPIPRVRSISLSYTQLNRGPEERIPYLSCNIETWGCAPVTTWPEGGMTALIQQVLSQFASEGGPVFRVEKVETSYGPRWEVIPEEVRDKSGRFSFQPDVLAANVYVPREQRSLAGLLEAVCDRLTQSSGHKVGIASAPVNPFSLPAGLLGAENVSAREALADLMGRTLVLRMYYAPDNGMYYANLENLPYREPPRPPPPPPPKVALPQPELLAPGRWLFVRSHTPEGVLDIQNTLAKLGYLRTAPTTKWDANAAEAIRRFQVASGLEATGAIDAPTILKLLPSLPMVTLPNPPPSPKLMYPALAYWLGTTPTGRKELQEALANAGFFSGPITDTSYVKIRDALRAFQIASGLQPSGQLDEPTGEKLFPYLPKQ